MKLSTDRILTTHVGSLPRPEDLLSILQEEDQGNLHLGPHALAHAAEGAVRTVVEHQMKTGIDVVSDGEFGKHSYTHYIKHRVTGIENVERERGQPQLRNLDDAEFADWAKGRNERPVGARVMAACCCTGQVKYADRAPLDRDIANFEKATASLKPVEGFLNAASPGVLMNFLPNRYYPSDEEYLCDLANAMEVEYKAITDAGYILQIDSPDIAMTRNSRYADKTEAEFLKIAERNMEALNHATRDIAPEKMRLHLCWGNYAGPHKNDIEVKKIMDVVLKTRAQAISFEGANPRHEHEWEDWKTAKIPDDKVLIPGVIDSATNFVEHPRLVAQRIGCYVAIVGRERVIAGADCGFGTFGRSSSVYESVVWAKFEALAEGAAIATKKYWGKGA